MSNVGANCEIFPDHEENKVVARFIDPATLDVILELFLEPETAREMAFSLTRASIPLEL